ncbi:citrate lyase subunit alpha [Succinispira mobilis]|uniref:citrate lyase subunit alpha n=1 Tax=Succinispira mobilis TaxID=78120 RepID=UPI00036F1553|nr:citrate lyase subunit alpha [Succinispira mobilis]
MREIDFQGAFCLQPEMRRYAPLVKRNLPSDNKLLASIEDAFKTLKITSGMTLSFHHHLRNGDYVLNMVLAVAAKLQLKDLKIAVSSIFPSHKPLIEHIKNGVVTELDTNYISGPVAEAVSQGILAKPITMRTHGGRARAIECGQLKIDVAFIAAPAADCYGNLNGVYGKSACGSLGYAMPDAQYAEKVVAITDNLMPYPLYPVSIAQDRVDYVLVVESIGDAAGIVSGTTKITKDPVGLIIARNAAQVIKGSGLLKEGFSFQTGAGGASLATAHFVKQIMQKEQIKGSFMLGGITNYMVEMLEEGYFQAIMDVQGFEHGAIRSLLENPNHLEISAGVYASPFNSGAAVNKLDAVILGATEIDTGFNVNVTTGSDGKLMGGSGGHSDAAAGAKTTIIVANLLRGRLPIIIDKVTTRTTPGETVDVLVTERGIAVNPKRKDLQEQLKTAGIKVFAIEELKQIAENIAGKPAVYKPAGKVIAQVEYRDGTIIDQVYQTK